MKNLLNSLWAGIEIISCSKQFLVMRLIVFFTILSMSQVFAENSYSQNTKLTLELQDISIEKVLDEIENQSEFYFLFNQKLVDVDRKVDVSVKNVRIKNILKKLFKGTETEFVVVDRQILLMPKDMAQNIENKPFLVRGIVNVTGLVTDNEGNSLPSATIVVVGTDKATVTDLDGKFTLELDDSEELTLEISFVGMAKKTIVWNGETNLNVVLEYSGQTIDEVYVTGYQTISRERATGSFSKIKTEDMESFYDPDVTSLLEGKVAGLRTDEDGNIFIRGISTFRANSKPLIVIDGLPVDGQWNETGYSALDDINPNDIESVTVLKDAAASSIYGARAANGVIVVTTKSAKVGKTEVDFSMNYTITPKNDQSYRNIISTSDYIDYEKSYLDSTPAFIADPVAFFDQKDGANTSYSPVYYYYNQWARGNMTETEAMAAIENLKNNEEYRKQYVDNALQNQFKQQYNLSFRTATEKSNIVLSINALTDKAEQINNKSEKYTLYFKNNLKLYDWVNIGYGLNIVMGKDERPNVYNGDGMYNAYPYQQLVDADGNRVYRDLINRSWADTLRTKVDEFGLYDLKYNVLDELEENKETTKYSNTRMFLNADFKITDWLSYDAMFQYELVSTNIQTYYSEETYTMREAITKYAEFVPGTPPWVPDHYNFHLPQGGRLTNGDKKQNNYTLRNQLNLNKILNDKHAITALAGFEIRENKYNSFWSDLYGYDNETLASQAVDWKTLSTGVPSALYPTGTQGRRPLQNKQEKLNRYISLYANAGYTYAGKYSITGSYRTDQTNLFGTDPKYRYRPLWSAGASWLVSGEGFMSSIEWINMLKIRTSYGVGGNVDQTTSPYLKASVWNSFYTGNNITFITQAPNPLLRWEKTTTYNIGADFSMFNGRLAGSIDGYWRYSDDLLAKKKFDPTLGFESGIVNNGAMSNKGFELSLSYNWVNKADLSVTTILTAAYNKNNVESIDYDPDVADDLWSGYYLEGSPISAIYAHRYAGLVDSTGNPSVWTIIEDANGNDKDTVIATGPQERWEALVNMGQTDPKWHGSFQPVIRYKGFRLSALIAFYTGHVMRDNVTPLYKSLSGGNVHGDMVNAWTPDNRNTDIPRMSTYDNYDSYRRNNWKYADIHIIDASRVDIRNIVLSYTLPQHWTQTIKASMVRLNFQVNNPWYWSASLQSNYTTRPILPFYVFGVNVKF